MKKPEDTKRPVFDTDLGSYEQNIINREAHEAYQRALKEHVVLQRAIESGLLENSPSVKMKFQEHTETCRRRESDPRSPFELANFAVSLMIDPSRLFPEIADIIENEFKEIDVSDLINKFDPSENKKLSKLDPNSVTRLKALASSEIIVNTLKCELLHDKNFVEHVHKNGIADRLDKWVADGYKTPQKTIKHGLIGGFVLATGPLGVMSASATYLAGHLLDAKQKLLNLTINAVLPKIAKKFGRKGETERNIREQTEFKLADKLGSKKVVPFLFVSAAALSLCLVKSIDLTVFSEPLLYDISSQVESLSDKLDAGTGNKWSVAWKSVTSYNLPPTIEKITSHIPSLSDNKLVNIITGTFVSVLGGKLKDKFEFENNSDPLKSSPLIAQELSLKETQKQSGDISQPTADTKAPFCGPAVTQLSGEVVDSTAEVSSQAKPDKPAPATSVKSIEADTPDSNEANDSASTSQATPGF